MQKIRIHGTLLDSGGEHQAAGAELIVSGEKKAGHITAVRAEQLVKINSAADVAPPALANPAAEDEKPKKAAKAG